MFRFIQLTPRELLFSLFNGFLIGIANLIPGVSGGTFALVLGLYDRLIQATTNINLTTFYITWNFIKSPHRRESRVHFAEELRRIDAYFLTAIALGVGLAIFLGAKIIQYLLANYPSLTLALFIGLILPSLNVPWKMMERKSFFTIPWIVPGIVLAIVPVFLIADKAGSDHPLVGFLTGSIAISAMILPGVSGSYIMLVLGEYQVVLDKLVQPFAMDSILFLGSFALGCLFGLIAFTRVIRYLLEHHKSSTMAFLIGLILGSFFILWPFKDYSGGQEIVGRSGEVKRDIQIATAKNIRPQTPDDLVPVLGAVLIGLVLGYGLNYIERFKGPEYRESHPYHPHHPPHKKELH